MTFVAAASPRLVPTVPPAHRPNQSKTFPAMMSLPFLTASIAIVLGWCGLRGTAAWFTILTVVVTLALFSLHATDSLDIDL